MAGNSKDLVLKLRFNAENKEFIGQVKSSANVVDDLGNKSNKAGAGLKTLSKESKSAGVDLSSLKSQVLGLAGGFSALAVAINAKDTLGQYQDMRTQITALVGGKEQWLQTEQYLNQVAEEHNKTILDMAQSYARLSVLQEAGLVTQRETMMLFEGMSNAQSQLGATTTQLDQAMYGLSQALASPIVRAEELNQVVEPLPGLLNKLDKAAGLNAGGFRQMMLDGKVTSDFFKTTLIKALADYEGAAARTAQNVNAQQAAFSRSYQQMVLAFEKPISTVFSNSISASVSVLDTFAANADLITDLVGVALFAAMGRGAAAVASMTKVKIRDIAADRQKIVAEQQKNVVELASIQSEIRHLEVMRATNAQRFAATGAVNALAAAEAREKVVKDALAASQARLNVTMRAGSVLMGALGGPLGIAMMAAGAIGYFALTSDQAKDSSEGLKDELSKLISEYKELNEVGKERFAQNLANGAVEARRALIDTQIAINKVKSELADAERSGSPLMVQKRIELSSLEAQAEKFEQAVVKSNAAYQELLKTNTDGKWQEPVGEGSQTEEQEKALKAGERMLENLAKQAALYGNTSEVARVRYEIEKGSLQGINDQLKEQLLLQARIIDQKRAAEENPKEEPKTDKIDDFFDSSDDLNSSYLQRLAIQADYENRAKIQEQYAYAERQEQLKLRFEEAYAQAQGNHSLMNTLESEYFQNRQVLRQEHEMNLTDISKQAADERAAYQQRVAADTLSFTQQQLSITTDFLRQSGQEQSAMYRTLLAVQKLAAIPSMIIATEEAATKALTLGPIAGPIASAAVKTLGYASVGIVAGQAIAGQAHDGINRVPKENEGTWLLKANEMVLNPAQADNFRWMVGAMQQMKSAFGAMSASSASSNFGGGVVVNIHTPAGTQTRQQESVAPDGSKQIDFYIEKAKQATLDAMYQDADNGGPITTRIRASA
ncbi:MULTISPECIES: tape measure protein [unclassified Vibrio]|uniref:tape measure protein n=1 Tax=unclassified Vibrio TaxID=2614977 RepID=UPI0029280B76|nr:MULTISPECIES: tape measure protein [unclassified Vibrio]MDU9591538.1 tape measure protein [Vibrio sp. 2-1-2a]MDU9602723.1 tape measure protein [Vibrio sp. 1-2-3a]